MRLDIFAQVLREGVREVIDRDHDRLVSPSGLQPPYEACEHADIWTAPIGALWVVLTTPTHSLAATTPTIPAPETSPRQCDSCGRHLAEGDDPDWCSFCETDDRNRQKLTDSRAAWNDGAAEGLWRYR